MTTIRLFRHYLRVPLLILGIVEATISFCSMYAAAYIRFDSFQQANYYNSINLFFPAIIFSLVFTVCMVAVGLYQAKSREGLIGVIQRMVVASFLTAITLSAIFYMIPQLFIGRGLLVIALCISVISIGMLRYIVSHRSPDLFKRNVLVIGAGKKAKSITELRRRTDRIGFNLNGFVHIRGEHDEVEKDKIIRLQRSLSEYILHNDINEIVLAIDDRRNRYIMDDLLDCKLSGINIIEIQTFFERETGKVLIEHLNPSWLVFSDGFYQGVIQQYAKRAFDIFASSILLFLTTPFILFAIMAIYIESGFRAPVFYRQVRVGEDGKPFTLLKFRSMRVDAEKKGSAQWATKNDSRVTKVGKIIRKTRIDELPQIYNVLKGDMSFVGPRPERPNFVVDLAEKIPYYAERHRVKPGITGWAQLLYPYGSSEKDAREKLQYDIYYLKNQGLFLDTLILIKTVEVVLFGKGAR
jgi:sugar transferase (PEP-CTERM system associated)